ncbi:hypothetical protein DPMN_191872 [Dreissena polymorpha]|uniref:Uncharacterized protein n=1 Tax=Dreissena polymorpha TaxID=45954 RepID=A0A9D3Y1K0_DREPO|nr:hypothetical protein DPMN_191872 [Dreissena polymorpha]
MQYSHERCSRAGHGRRALLLPSLPWTTGPARAAFNCNLPPCPSNDLQQPIVTPKQGMADGPHRRASSAPETMPCGGAMDMSRLSCCK